MGVATVLGFKQRKTIFHVIILFAVLFTTASAPAKTSGTSPGITVLVSINPLYLAVKEAFADIVNTELLLSATVNPHHYSLKPSEAKKLRTADMVVWIGPELELFLIKPLQQRTAQAQTVFAALPWLKARQADRLLRINQLRETAADDHVHQHNDVEPALRSAKTQSESQQAIATIDPHLWLSKSLMILVIQGIQQRLTELHPELTNSLNMSVNSFTERLRSQWVSPLLKTKKFISYHNSFDYLAADTGFAIVDVMTTNTELRPGAHRVLAVKKLTATGDICLITEPQFKGGILTKLLDQDSEKIVEIDPMGRTYSRYSDFLADTLNRLAHCGKAN
jgi:zinc transport system substrate-binding protein